MDTLAVQTALAALGYAVAIDGVMGPKTRLALQTFQRGRGLAADGIVGPQTVKALQAAMAEKRSAAKAPTQPAEALSKVQVSGFVTVSAKGVAEILSHEAIVTSPYRDSVGVWTIGIGHTKSAGQPDPAAIAKGVQRPVAEMIAIFKDDLPKYEADVRAAVKVPLEQHQFDALVSFHFNTGAIGRASFVTALNAGQFAGAAAAIMAWNKPAEIVERRRAEQTLFRSGVYSNDGKATIYPASASGAVLWSKGKRVVVADLI